MGLLLGGFPTGIDFCEGHDFRVMLWVQRYKNKPRLTQVSLGKTENLTIYSVNVIEVTFKP